MSSELTLTRLSSSFPLFSFAGSNLYCLSVEEPFAGLDPEGRTEVSQVLHELNDGGLTRVVLVLRSGEELPAWVTNVVEVQPALTATSDETPGGPVLRFGSNGDEKRWWADKLRADTAGDVDASSSAAPESTTEGAGKEVVRMEGVDVVYGEKKVRSLPGLASSTVASL